MIDAYEPFKRSYYPSSIEIDSYIRMLDHDGDGKVSLRDLEYTCIRYFSQKMWSIKLNSSDKKLHIIDDS